MGFDLLEFDHVVLFPGLILHELSHLLACLLTGTKVTGVKIWGMKEAYVKHEEPGPFSMIIIAFAPFVLNSLFSLAFLYGFFHQVTYSHDIAMSLIYFWVALSSAYFAFPSLGDVNNAYQVLVKNWFSAMVGKKGLLWGFLSWLLFIPIFVPMMVLIGIMYVFSQVEGLGLVWFIALFLVMMKTLGV